MTMMTKTALSTTTNITNSLAHAADGTRPREQRYRTVADGSDEDAGMNDDGHANNHVNHNQQSEYDDDDHDDDDDDENYISRSVLDSGRFTDNQIMAMISNFSTSYNALNISLVLPILKVVYKSTAFPLATSSSSSSTLSSITAAAAATTTLTNNSHHSEPQALVASSLLIGMILGQLLGGILGDSRSLGPIRAIVLVMIVQVVASLGSSMVITKSTLWGNDSFNNNDSNHNPNTVMGKGNDDTDDLGWILYQLAAWRLVLGIGAGAVYPLAAVLSASQEEDDEEVVAVTDDQDRNFSPQPDPVNTDNNRFAQDYHDDEHNDSHHNDVDIFPSRHFDDGQSKDSALHRVVLTFSVQGIGFWMVPAIAACLLYMIPTKATDAMGNHEYHQSLGMVWRILLALGSIPGLILLFLHHRRTRWGQSMNHIVPASPIHEIRSTVSPRNTLVEGREGRFAGAEIMNGTTTTLTQEAEGDLADPNTSEGTDELDLSLTEPDSLLRTGRLPRSRMDQTNLIWAAIRDEPELVRKLLGTALTWFLFDVLFYGNALFEPLVIGAALGPGSTTTHNNQGSGSSNISPHSSNLHESDALHTLRQTAMASLILKSIALPGYILAALWIGKPCCGGIIQQTPRYVMMQGFAVMSVLYLIIGVAWQPLRHQSHSVVLIILYGFTFFFANYGPNTTTFVLPSQVFTEPYRSTWNGVCAASGKLGAWFGATLFAPVAQSWGNGSVMILCAIVAWIAFLLTACFVPQ